MTQHLIQDSKIPEEKYLFDVDFRDDQISVNESGTLDERGVVIEYRNGAVVVRIYTLDKDAPLSVSLPDTGGYVIDNFDICMEG